MTVLLLQEGEFTQNTTPKTDNPAPSTPNNQDVDPDRIDDIVKINQRANAPHTRLAGRQQQPL